MKINSKHVEANLKKEKKTKQLFKVSYAAKNSN